MGLRRIVQRKGPIRLRQSGVGRAMRFGSLGFIMVLCDLPQVAGQTAGLHATVSEDWPRVNPEGLAVLSTYSEWKNSPYAKRGTQCQDCHMALISGRVVALNVNEGSGHCFPTGLPMHRAVLEVAIRNSGAEIGRREIPFEVVMLDKQGRSLRREHAVFLHGAKVRSNTRLKPKETRTIDVSFRDISASRLMLTAALYYEHSTEPLVMDDAGERIEPVAMKFFVASH